MSVASALHRIAPQLGIHGILVNVSRCHQGRVWHEFEPMPRKMSTRVSLWQAKSWVVSRKPEKNVDMRKSSATKAVSTFRHFWSPTACARPFAPAAPLVASFNQAPTSDHRPLKHVAKAYSVLRGGLKGYQSNCWGLPPFRSWRWGGSHGSSFPGRGHSRLAGGRRGLGPCCA
jgi:hypothetical protein